MVIQKTTNKEAHYAGFNNIHSKEEIITGALVYFTGSGFPDLIVGGVIFLIVIRGAMRILKL